MKTNIFLVLLCASLLVFGSCTEPKGLNCDSTYGPPSYTKSYIQYFISADKLLVWPVEYFGVSERNKIVYPDGVGFEPNDQTVVIVDYGIHIRLEFDGSGEYIYDCAGHIRYPSESCLELSREYEALVTEIGDVSFNREIRYFERVTYATLAKIQSVTITADKDFNADYPAGSSLNELFTIYFNDAYAFIKNNYQPITDTYQYFTTECTREYPYAVVKKKLSAVNFPEHLFIDHRWDCILDIAPQYTDVYTFYVKIVLEDGTTLEASTSFTVKGEE